MIKLTQLILKESVDVIVYRNDLKDSRVEKGMHFGTLKAAKQRRSFVKNIIGKHDPQSVSIKKYRLRMNNPIFLTDREANDEAILRKSVLDGKYPQLVQWANDYKITLESLGFDGIAYINDVEDPGSISYVIFNPSQVEELEKYD